MFGYSDCLRCKHSTGFPQGLYCFELQRYVSKTEDYQKACSLFTDENEQADSADLWERCKCSGWPLEADYCKHCGGYKGR